MITKQSILLIVLICAHVGVPAAQGQDNRLEATPEPFQYSVWMDDHPVVAQNAADTAHTALYFITRTGAQYLNEPIRFEVSDTTLDAAFNTTDGRRADLAIRPAAHGGYMVEVAFSPDEGILAVGEMLRARPEERFHGLSERVIGNHDDAARDPSVPAALDRRGHFVEMAVNGTISLYTPFYLSSEGYGLFVEGTWTGYFDMASRVGDRIQFQFDGPSLTYHVFLDESPSGILDAYTGITGRPLLPPRWGFGHYRWRDDHENPDTLFDGTAYRGPYNSMVYEDVSMMEKLDIPLDVYWVDRPWARGAYGYDDFVWDEERFPQADAMIEWLEDDGTKFLLWIAPWVMGAVADSALDRGYFLPSKGMVAVGLRRADDAFDSEFLQAARPRMEDVVRRFGSWDLRMAALTYLNRQVDGDDAAALDRARADLIEMIRAANGDEDIRRLLPMGDRGYVLIDFSNPEARQWWQGYIGRLVDQGVDAFKLDRAEEFVPGDRDVYAHDGRSLAELRNAYPVLYAEAVHEVMQEKRGDDFVVMPRAGYAGSQQFAVFWAGDTRASWIGFRNAYIGGLRAAVMGFPFWGSDTGGYWGGTTTTELFQRWLAVSAFSPIMEVGPLMNEAPWDMPDGTGYNEEAIATWRTYVLIHKHLQDYTYEYAEEARATGAPIMRPLFFEYPDDERAWAIWDEFLYGQDILVAPVLNEGARSREVYLPRGAWIDAWSRDRTVQGPATVVVDAPPYRTPIFVRADAGVHLPELEQLYRESIERAEQHPQPGDGSDVR